MNHIRSTAIVAKTILEQNPLFLDTETTGWGSRAQIVEIAVLDMDGNALIDTLVRATCPIGVGAARVHGIVPDMLTDAPTFDQILDKLSEILHDRTCVIYNLEFDHRLMWQSGLAHGVQELPFENVDFKCAMLLYAEFWREKHDYNEFRWQKLGSEARQQKIVLPKDLHRARADAELTDHFLFRLMLSPENHRARADAELTRRLMIKMSEASNGQV